MRIIGPPSAERHVVKAGLTGDPTVHPRFYQEMFDHLWDAAVGYNIDPVGVVAQSYKETGRGHFGGAVQPGFRNTCGLKVRYVGMVKAILGTADDDHPLLHQQFPSWRAGAEAHVQHLRAYASWPVDDLVVDPRYEWVAGGYYRLENFEELSGRWAPSPTYGQELVAIARKLVAA